MVSKSIALAATLLLSLQFAAPAYSECTHGSKPENELAFHQVNEQLHKNYANAKNEIRAKLGPLVICTNESISLIKGKDKTTVPFIKPRYTGLKEVAHITLGTFVLLTNHTDESLTDDQIQKLQSYKAAIEKATPDLQKNEGLKPEDLARQEELIKTTTGFLAKVIGDKRVSGADLQAFCRSTSVADLENAYEAAGSQITTMDEAMTKWHKEMSPEEWDKMHVIIMTSHMPRQKLLSHQYFIKLLNDDTEGGRLIIAEGLTDEEQAIDLLLTHILDGKVAVAFFKDPLRMHRDLLSDGAAKYLQKHKITGNLGTK